MKALSNSLYKAYYFLPHPTLIISPFGDKYLAEIRSKGELVTGLQVTEATIDEALDALTRAIDEEYPGESCETCHIPAVEYLNGRDYCQSCYNSV